MKQVSVERICHAMALLTVVIWGATFISTKILLQHGLNPAEILFYRFLLAYIVLFCFSPRFHKAGSIKDELLFMVAGITGGSLYFLAENTALKLTLASNVALLVSLAPIFTALLLRSKNLGKLFFLGSAIALLGVFFVVYNGRFMIEVNPLGDILAVSAAFLWALYSITLTRLDGRYDTLFITRKVFFWGLITLIPVFFFMPFTRDTQILFQPVVIGHLVFLALLASLLCYVMWNYAIKKLGAIRTSNYIYIIPLITLVVSNFTLDEPITFVAIIGTLCVLGGLYLVQKTPAVRNKQEKA